MKLATYIRAAKAWLRQFRVHWFGVTWRLSPPTGAAALGLQVPFRCFAYLDHRGIWIGHCVDLSLAAQAGNVVQLQRKLSEQISGFLRYVEFIDDESIRDQLLGRTAPIETRLRHRLTRIFGAPLTIGMIVTLSAGSRPRRSKWPDSDLPNEKQDRWA